MAKTHYWAMNTSTRRVKLPIPEVFLVATVRRVDLDFEMKQLPPPQ